MTSRLLISLSLLSAALVARAQNADDFFNGGAQLYLSNNVPAALERTEAGLKQYPADEKLKKLEELLKQKQQQNQQNQNQQNQQKQQDQSPPPPPKNDQQKQDQQKPSPKKPDPAKEKQNEDQQPAAKAQSMSAKEAEKLLDSQKEKERVLRFRPPDKPKDDRPVKDW